jgi:hypothetical protein
MVARATQTLLLANVRSSWRNAAGAAAPRPRGTTIATPTALTDASTATAQNAARHPSCCPTRAPSGTPTTLETVRPPRSTASAFARAPAGASVTETTAAAAQKVPHATAVMIRAVINTP